jgi:thioredoxin-related protein
MTIKMKPTIKFQMKNTAPLLFLLTLLLVSCGSPAPAEKSHPQNEEMDIKKTQTKPETRNKSKERIEENAKEEQSKKSIQHPIDKQAIVFHEGSWASALNKAEQEKKLIFFDAHASWCRPCKLMKKTVFTDTAVARLFNSHFINIEMDMEKGEGKDLSSVLDIKAYPTLLFINEKGEVKEKKIGFLSAPELLSFAKTALKKQH